MARNGHLILNNYRLFLNTLNQLVAVACMVMLCTLVVVVLAAIFYRYVLSDSLSWSAEVARYLCVWIGFLAASLVLFQRGHIGLEYFVNKLPPSARRSVKVVCDAVVLIFLIVITYLGIGLAIFQIPHQTPALQISMIWPYLSVPVGAILMALQCFYLLMEDATRRED